MNNIINKLGKCFNSLIFTYAILFFGVNIYDRLFTFGYNTFDFFLSIIIGILTLALVICVGEFILKKVFPSKN